MKYFSKQLVVTILLLCVFTTFGFAYSLSTSDQAFVKKFVIKVETRVASKGATFRTMVINTLQEYQDSRNLTQRFTAIIDEIINQLQAKELNIIFDSVVAKKKEPVAKLPTITILSPNGGENFTQGSQNIIKWTGGKNKVQVGLVKDNFNLQSGNMLGWISLNSLPNDKVSWDGKSVTDLAGNTVWTVVPGSYKILVVSESSAGNYCYGTLLDCSNDLSDKPFTINAVCSLTAKVSDVYSTEDNNEWGFKVGVSAKNQPNTSRGWIANFQGYTPEVTAYGVKKTYGYFLTSHGPLQLTVQDQVDKNCTTTITVNPITVVSPPTLTLDTVPRIAYWGGKVGQHTDVKGNRISDPDGTSGVVETDAGRLAYCKKWYPNTVNTETYKAETITTWKRSMYYEQSNYTNTVPTYKCVGATHN